MKLSTRLLLSLLPAAAAIMAAYAFWALQQREETLVREARTETRAYAIAVGLAFQHAFRDLQFRDVQEILNEISRRPQVYGVLVYDTLGDATIVSEGTRPGEAVSPARIRGVVESGEPLDLDRALGEQSVFSVLRPLRDREGRVTGVLEVMQPLSFVEAEKTRTTQRFLLNTLTLLAVLAALTLWLARRFVDRPIQRFVEAIRGVGRGDLSQRVPEGPSGAELAQVAREFNRMAEGLEEARDALLRESEERLELERQVRESEKLASLGTLAAGVAHQIAAPLNVIEGRARRLRSRAGDLAGPELERNLDAIIDQSGRITRIVRGLLDFARRPEPTLRPVDLRRVIADAVERMEAGLAEGQTELRRQEGEALWVRADPDLLEEVLVILLTNALEAVRETPPPRRIALDAGTEGTAAWVEVVDSGPGIPEGAIPRVFEAFYTTKPGGTGLGLTVARRLIEGLGGRIEVDLEGGTVLRFTLPLLDRTDVEEGPGA